MLEQKIFEFIMTNKLIENNDRVVLGVSGGPDSICMLDILNKIKNKKLIDFEIFVCHVNHGLRENGFKDEEFVKEFCEKIDVQFFTKHIDIKKIANENKKGIEETGRIERYAFFDEIANAIGGNKIATAHNRNDKVETIIMNVLRGSGTKGLTPMDEINGKYIKPLIETERTEIEEYLKTNNIIARHDESNDDNTYTRNKIRNIVIPYIQNEFNPNIITTITRLSDIIKEQEDYLENCTEKAYKQICLEEINVTKNFEHNKSKGAEIILDLKKFNMLEKIIQKRIIFYAINKIFGTTKGIEKVHIEDIIKLCNNNIGNKYLTPNKNIKIVTQKKQLKIIVQTS